MLRKIQSVLIALVFIIPIVGNLTINSDTVLSQENRTAFNFPKFNSLYYDFSGFLRALNDRLFGREFAQKYTLPYVQVLLSQKAEISDFAVEGIKTGWFFQGDHANKVYSKHVFDVTEKDKLIDNVLIDIDKIKNEVTQNVYLVVGPDKHGIYSDYMNQCIGHPGKYRYFDKTKKYVDELGYKVIDNYEAMINGKDKTEKTTIFYADDGHWNLKGANVAFNNTMQQILGASYNPIAYSFMYKKHSAGDLNKNSLIAKTKTTLDDAIVKSDIVGQFYFKDLESGEEVKIDRELGSFPPIYGYVEEDNTNFLYSKSYSFRSNLKVALVSDSFGYNFKPFLIDYFKETLWINVYLERGKDKYKIFKYLKAFNPDLVLYLRMENSL